MADTQIGIRVLVLGVAEAHRQLGALRNDMTRFAADTARAGMGAAAFGRSLVRTGDAIVSFGRTLTFGLSMPIALVTGTLLKAGIDFEQAFVGVGKTVEGVAKGFKEIAEELYGTAEGLSEVQKQAVWTSESFGELTELGEKLRAGFVAMSLDIPIATTELARIGQVSGQLGVSATQIEDFTRTIAMMSVTTDLSSEEAAFAIARIANIMGVETEKMAEFARRAGAAIVALGNTTASTEPEIVNMALRLAAAGRVTNLTTAEILGLSASLAEMGIRAERGGTAVSRLLYEMMYAIAEGGDNLEIFARIMGVTIDEMEIMFKRDALSAIELFMTRLVELQEAGQITKDDLIAMGLSGVRVKEVMNILGPNIELVRENVARANYEWEEQIALLEEFKKQSITVRNQLQLLKNAFVALGTEVLRDLQDDVRRIVSGMRSLIQSFIDMDPAIRRSILRFGLLIATFGPILLALGTLTQLTGNAIIGLSKLGGAFKGLLLLPFSPLTSIFGLLFGKKGKGKTGGVLSGLFKFIPTPKTFTQSVKGIVGFFSSILSGAISPVIKLISGFFGTVFSGGLRLLISLPREIGSFLRSVISMAFAFVADVFVPGFGKGVLGVARLFLAPLELIGKLLSGILGSLFTGLGKLLGVFGSVLKILPGVGATLLSFLIKPLMLIPKLALLAAGAFTLLFAPDVISAAIRNKDKLFDEIKLSFSQFRKDLEAEGLERAIMLFVSGGSTGSGRKGGLLGIARALGAGEENARKFSYAMGVAAHYVIQIVNATANLIRDLISGTKETDKLGNKSKSTAERLVSLANAIAQILRGFFAGWTSSFSRIRAAFEVFKDSISRAISTIDRLFENIFGKPKEEIKDFYDELEPGADSTAFRIGTALGRIFGWIITTGLYTLTLITNVINAIAEAFNTVVTAYETGGIKGVFAELGPILAGLWDGIIDAAEDIWEEVKTPLQEFLSSVLNWIADTGIPALLLGAKSLWGTLKDALSTLWEGTPERVIGKPVQMFRVLKNTGEELGVISEEALKAAKRTGELLGYKARLYDVTKGEYLFSEFVFLPFMGLETSLQPAGEGLKTEVETLFNSIKDWIVGPGKDKLIEAINAIGGFIKDELWTEHLKPYVDPFVEQLKQAMRDAGTAIGNAFIDGLKDIITPDKLAEAYTKIKEGDITGGLAALSEFLTAPMEKAMGGESVPLTGLLSSDKFKELEDIAQRNGKTVGEMIALGVKAGVITEEQGLLLRIQYMAYKLISTIKIVLGIGSPSTVFLAIGRDIILGLALGMASMQGYLQSILSAILSQLYTFMYSVQAIVTQVQTQIAAIQTLATAIATTATTAITGILGVLGGTAPATTMTTSYYQPTYSPVFYGPQPATTYQQERQVYQQYLLAQHAVG